MGCSLALVPKSKTALKSGTEIYNMKTDSAPQALTLLIPQRLIFTQNKHKSSNAFSLVMQTEKFYLTTAAVPTLDCNHEALTR